MEVIGKNKGLKREEEQMARPGREGALAGKMEKTMQERKCGKAHSPPPVSAGVSCKLVPHMILKVL